MKTVTIPAKVTHFSDAGDEYPTAEHAMVADISNAVHTFWQYPYLKGSRESLFQACQTFAKAYLDSEREQLARSVEVG